MSSWLSNQKSSVNFLWQLVNFMNSFFDILILRRTIFKSQLLNIIRCFVRDCLSNYLHGKFNLKPNVHQNYFDVCTMSGSWTISKGGCNSVDLGQSSRN